MLKSALSLLLSLASLSVVAATIQGVRIHESPDATRIVLDTSGAVKYKYFNLDKPHRVVIDVSNARAAEDLNLAAVAKDLKRIKRLRGAPRGTRVPALGECTDSRAAPPPGRAS
mgnify:CR=1 FL=1